MSRGLPAIPAVEESLMRKVIGKTAAARRKAHSKEKV
jgi:hypothetical protein